MEFANSLSNSTTELGGHAPPNRFERDVRDCHSGLGFRGAHRRVRSPLTAADFKDKTLVGPGGLPIGIGSSLLYPKLI